MNINIGVVIAGAGLSLRMGQHKALINIFGKPNIYQHILIFSPNIIYKLFFTLPINLLLDSQLKNNILDNWINLSANKYFNLGYIGSIKTILELAGHELDGIIISPIDVPMISRKLISLLVNLAKLRKNQPCIIVPHLGLNPGHPIYCSKKLFMKLIHANHPDGLRGFIRFHKKYVSRVYYPCPRIITNLNHPSDLLTWSHDRIHASFEADTCI